MSLPVRITQAPATPALYPAQKARPEPPTPADIGSAAYGQRLRPVEDVIQERRQPGRSEVLPFGPIDSAAARLPIKLG